jgi:integrase
MEALFTVRVCRMSDGERLPLVIDGSGIPVPGPNQYALLLRRPQVQSSSLGDELATLAHVYDWARRRSLDLDERLESGNGLSPDEIAMLYQNLRYRRPFARNVAAKRLTEIEEPDVVAIDVHRSRVYCARDYLTWRMDRAMHDLDVSVQRLAQIAERRDRIARLATIDRAAPRSIRKGLTKAFRTRLLQVVNPESSANPFQRRVRFRNWILVLLLLTFGFRRGESLKIRVSDVHLSGRAPTLSIVRRPDDPEDPRLDEPAVKTHGREVPLVRDMVKVLDAFIQFHRPQFPNADQSPFLVFSVAGQPMSLRQVNDILEQVCRRFPEFDGLLTPHVLRYTYNDSLRDASIALGMSDIDRQQAQNYLNGWSLESEQATHYTQRTSEKNAQLLSLQHQRSLFA